MNETAELPRKGDIVRVWDSIHQEEVVGRVRMLGTDWFLYRTPRGADRFADADSTWEVIL